jgi:hypothetical protein
MTRLYLIVNEISEGGVMVTPLCCDDGHRTVVMLVLVRNLDKTV